MLRRFALMSTRGKCLYSVIQKWSALFGLGNAYKVDYRHNHSVTTKNSKSIDLVSVENTELHQKVYYMVQYIEKHGHMISEIDPLNKVGKIQINSSMEDEVKKSLDFSSFGFTKEDMDRILYVSFSGKFSSFVHPGVKPMKAMDIYNYLIETFCGKLGFEYRHLKSNEEINWFRNTILDQGNYYPVNQNDKIQVLKDILQAELFENILNDKFGTAKRFGLDGGESLIAGLNAIVRSNANWNTDTITIGMAHRGRLNTLHNVCGKSMIKIFKEFQGKADKNVDVPGNATGDVKYHMGYTNTLLTKCISNTNQKLQDSKKVNIILLPNPSHLECINPVLLGVTKAIQDRDYNGDKQIVLPITIHGDSAFSGQGICYESLRLVAGNINSSTDNTSHTFNVGGTIHIVINNQIGFTTSPHQGRYFTYCSDLAKSIHAPVIHANGDYPLSVVKACLMASEYRRKIL